MEVLDSDWSLRSLWHSHLPQAFSEEGLEMNVGNINYRSISHGNSSIGLTFSKPGTKSETKRGQNREQGGFCTACFFSFLQLLIR